MARLKAGHRRLHGTYPNPYRAAVARRPG
jgi:hypothetical protein